MFLKQFKQLTDELGLASQSKSDGLNGTHGDSKYGYGPKATRKTKRTEPKA